MRNNISHSHFATFLALISCHTVTFQTDKICFNLSIKVNVWVFLFGMGIISIAQYSIS